MNKPLFLGTQHNSNCDDDNDNDSGADTERCQNYYCIICSILNTYSERDIAPMTETDCAS